MAASSSLVLFATLGLLFTTILVAAEAGPTDTVWFTSGGGNRCSGSIGECMDDADEFAMDSETNRRVLAGTDGYISYEALKADSTQCSQSGQSYYNSNCNSNSAPVNSYNRDCAKSAGCRS